MGQSRNESIEVILSDLESKISEESYRKIQLLVSAEPEALQNLRTLPIDQMLNPEERFTLRSLKISPPDVAKLHKQTVVILKATRLCNLRCTYCNAWRDGPGQIMEFPVLAKLIHDVLKTPGLANVDFVWHGGEVTLLPISYLEKALWLQEHFCEPGTVVANSIQTNATRLTVEWLTFLKDYEFGVGVSIDGPPEVHDKRRVTAGGRGTWLDVKQGIDHLREYEIPFGALAVIDECALEMGASAYLDYLIQLGITQVALLNALPPNSDDCSGNATYLPHNRFTSFLRDLFKAWWSHSHDLIEIRELQALVEAVRTGSTGLCIFNDNCMGQYLTIDPNGDVSACDKYVGDPDYLFGNIVDEEVNAMLNRSQVLEKASADVSQKKRAMTKCRHFDICFGGCPHDVRLTEKYRPHWNTDCCGLIDLIDDITSAVNQNTGTSSLPVL